MPISCFTLIWLFLFPDYAVPIEHQNINILIFNQKNKRAYELAQDLLTGKANSGVSW
jgi:hypothetical protein